MPRVLSPIDFKKEIRDIQIQAVELIAELVADESQSRIIEGLKTLNEINEGFIKEQLRRWYEHGNYPSVHIPYRQKD